MVVIVYMAVDLMVSAKVRRTWGSRLSRACRHRKSTQHFSRFGAGFLQTENVLQLLYVAGSASPDGVDAVLALAARPPIVLDQSLSLLLSLIL